MVACQRTEQTVRELAAEPLLEARGDRRPAFAKREAGAMLEDQAEPAAGIRRFGVHCSGLHYRPAAGIRSIPNGSDGYPLLAP
jgi:hypothetical protein